MCCASTRAGSKLIVGSMIEGGERGKEGQRRKRERAKEGERGNTYVYKHDTFEQNGTNEKAQKVRKGPKKAKILIKKNT